MIDLEALCGVDDEQIQTRRDFGPINFFVKSSWAVLFPWHFTPNPQICRT